MKRPKCIATLPYLICLLRFGARCLEAIDYDGIDNGINRFDPRDMRLDYLHR
jgi:hypothetical protein